MSAIQKLAGCATESGRMLGVCLLTGENPLVRLQLGLGVTAVFCISVSSSKTNLEYFVIRPSPAVP